MSDLNNQCDLPLDSYHWHLYGCDQPKSKEVIYINNLHQLRQDLLNKTRENAKKYEGSSGTGSRISIFAPLENDLEAVFGTEGEDARYLALAGFAPFLLSAEAPLLITAGIASIFGFSQTGCDDQCNDLGPFQGCPEPDEFQPDYGVQNPDRIIESTCSNPSRFSPQIINRQLSGLLSCGTDMKVEIYRPDFDEVAVAHIPIDDIFQHLVREGVEVQEDSFLEVIKTIDVPNSNFYFAIVQFSMDAERNNFENRSLIISFRKDDPNITRDPDQINHVNLNSIYIIEEDSSAKFLAVDLRHIEVEEENGLLVTAIDTQYLVYKPANRSFVILEDGAIEPHNSIGYESQNLIGHFKTMANSLRIDNFFNQRDLLILGSQTCFYRAETPNGEILENIENSSDRADFIISKGAIQSSTMIVQTNDGEHFCLIDHPHSIALPTNSNDENYILAAGYDGKLILIDFSEIRDQELADPNFGPYLSVEDVTSQLISRLENVNIRFIVQNHGSPQDHIYILNSNNEVIRVELPGNIMRPFRFEDENFGRTSLVELNPPLSNSENLVGMYTIDGNTILSVLDQGENGLIYRSHEIID